MKSILFCMVIGLLISVSALAHFDGAYMQQVDINGNTVTVGPISHAYPIITIDRGPRKGEKVAGHQHIFPENAAGAVSQTSSVEVDFGEEISPEGRDVHTREIRVRSTGKGGKSVVTVRTVKRVLTGYKSDVIRKYSKSRQTGFFDSNGNPINYDGTLNTAEKNSDCLKRAIAASYAYLNLDGPLPKKYDCVPPSGEDFWITQADPADIHAGVSLPAQAPVSTPQYSDEYTEEIRQVPVYEDVIVYEEVEVYDAGHGYVDGYANTNSIQIVTEEQVQAGEPGTVTLQAGDPSILREPIRRTPFAEESIVITHVVLKEPAKKKKKLDYRLYLYIKNESGGFRSDIDLYILDKDTEDVKFRVQGKNRHGKVNLLLSPQNISFNSKIRELYVNGDEVANNRFVLVRPRSIEGWDHSKEGYNRGIIPFREIYVSGDKFQLRWKTEVISEYVFEEPELAASPKMTKGKLATTWAGMKSKP